jgi:uncharacterized membrane protein (DUF373 family)
MRSGSGKGSTAPRSSVVDNVSRGFTLVEDVVYVGLGLLLSGAALALLGSLGINFWRGLVGGTLPGGVVVVLDQILLVLMIVELLYTVQLSFREHVLVPEPFVLVALIASVRRILVLAPELPKVVERGDVQFQNAMIELSVLTAMTLSLVFCLVLLRKRHPEAVAERV